MKPAAIMQSPILLSRLILSSSLFLCLIFQSLPAAAGVEAGVIAEPTIPFANMDMPTPKITAPNMDVPETVPRTQTIPENNSSTGQAQVSGNDSDAAPSQQQEEEDAISGKWTVRFQELRDRALDLTLWSSGKGKFMGFGTLTRGSSAVSMSASGSFAEEELLLAVKSAQPEYEGAESEQYDLDLFLKNSTLAGTYIMRTGAQGLELARGNATASKRMQL